MKNLTIGLFLTGMVLTGLGVAMAATNPSPDNYNDYATRRLTQYLRDNTCTKASTPLQGPCNELLDQNQDKIRELIGSNTERVNYGVLSIYKTHLSVGQLLPSFMQTLVPSYHFESVGLFSGFETYKAEKN